MKTVIYLFNGCGWGDHFLALPFINRQIQSNGPENVMVITYKNHIDNLFNNLHCHFIGIENSSFCFENIKNLILNFGPKKIISFNAFHPFDFDFHAKRFYKEVDFYGKFDELGTSIRQPFKNYAHIRDQYFLLSQEKIQYKKKDRRFKFIEKEHQFFQTYFNKKIGEINFKNLVVLHLDSEKRKLWGEDKCRRLIIIFLDANIRVLIVGQGNLNTGLNLVKQENLIILKENEIRPVFWLVSKCHFFVGIDSVFAHVADAYDINSLILFSDYNSHEWYHNSPNVSTIFPDAGKMTKDIPFQEVLYELKNKFPFNI